MINQLSNEQIAQLCLTVLKNRELQLNLEAEVIRHLSTLSHSNRLFIWRLVFNALSEYLKPSGINNLQDYLAHQISKTETADRSQTKSSYKNLETVFKLFPSIKENEIAERIKNNATDHSDNTKGLVEAIGLKNEPGREDPGENDGQYIQNAGLILIHPFIKTFLNIVISWTPNPSTS